MCVAAKEYENRRGFVAGLNSRRFWLFGVNVPMLEKCLNSQFDINSSDSNHGVTLFALIVNVIEIGAYRNLGLFSDVAAGEAVRLIGAMQFTRDVTVSQARIHNILGEEIK